MKQKKQNKRVSPGTLNEIVKKIKKERNLPSSFDVCYETIRSRYRRNQLTYPTNYKSGPFSPLAGIEQNLISFALHLSRARIPLSCGQGMMMINAAIDSTEAQKKLIQMQKKFHIVIQNVMGLFHPLYGIIF